MDFARGRLWRRHQLEPNLCCDPARPRAGRGGNSREPARSRHRDELRRHKGNLLRSRSPVSAVLKPARQCRDVRRRRDPVVARAITDEERFELSVANAGEPILPDALERLFAPFSRGAVQPNQQGLGLGLYIASQIAQAHGGRIDVTSTPEETRFTFKMPLASPRA